MKCNLINLMTSQNTLQTVQLCISTGSVSLCSCDASYIMISQLTSVKSSAFFSPWSRFGKLLTLSAFSCSYNTVSAVQAIPTAGSSELTEFS
jgi:hypothetical protein